MGALQGICIAPHSSKLDPTPNWTRLDDGVTRVASYSIDRGREFELDTTDGGRAQVSINDVDGSLDVTNTGGDLYGLLEEGIQAGIARWNPVTSTWHSRFRGFVSDYNYEFDPSMKVNRLTLDLVDIYEVLETTLMQPGAFGDPPPAANAGDVFFDNANVDDRILQAIGDAGLPTEFFVVFSGNVELWETVYSAGESMLTVIQEACDAEFPGVSNFYPDRFGRGCFHGRLAKWTPGEISREAGPDQWDFNVWGLGDSTYVAGAPASRVHLRQFAYNRGTSKVLNSALATPLNIADKDIAGQLVQDETSIGVRGYRSWSRQDLLTKRGLLDAPSFTDSEIEQGKAALAETKKFAEYIVTNYAEPKNRVTNIAVRPRRDITANAELWRFLCQVDIADKVTVTVASPGGGGFNAEPFYVEGVHEEVDGRLVGSAGTNVLDDVTLTLDLSPVAYFATPFPG